MNKINQYPIWLTVLNGLFKFFLTMLVVGVATAESVNYMVIEKQSRPLQIEEYSQNHSGIVTEVVEEIFNNSDHRLQYHTKPFPEMIRDLEGRRYTDWLTYGSPAWGGVQAANLSKTPIIRVSHQLITSAQGSWQFNKIEDLYGKTAVLLKGFDYPGLEQHLSPNKIRALWVTNYGLAFQMLNRLKEKAFFVEMDLRIHYNLKQQQIDPDNFRYLDFSSVIPDYEIYLAIDPHMETALQQFINDKMATISSNGKLAKIVANYR